MSETANTSTDTPLSQVVLFDKNHDVSSFNCGSLPLNEYLQKHALANQQNGSTRTYVTTRGNQVVAYYTLAPCSVARDEVPPRIAKGLGAYPVPLILIARLAVHSSEQRNREIRLGSAMLKDAILRAQEGARVIGGRGIVVHAKDELAKKYYTQFGFEPSPLNDLHLYILMKDIEKITGK